MRIWAWYYWKNGKLFHTSQETNELQSKFVDLNTNKNKVIVLFYLVALWMSNNAQIQMLQQV